jgi:hypothetical protein
MPRVTSKAKVRSANAMEAGKKSARSHRVRCPHEASCCIVLRGGVCLQLQDVLECRRFRFYHCLHPFVRHLRSIIKPHNRLKSIAGFLLTAACKESLDLVPKAWLTEDALAYPYSYISSQGPDEGDVLVETDFAIAAAARTRQLAPIPEDVLVKLALRDAGQFIHHAAAWGALNQLPKSLLTEDMLIRRCDDSGRNATMIAAQHGFLCHIPKMLLTKEALEYCDDSSRTIRDYAIAGGCLDQIPEAPELFVPISDWSEFEKCTGT